MAHKKYHRHHRRRHNPLGVSGAVVKEAALNSAGALGTMFLAGQFGQSGWAGVGVSAAASLAMLFGGKFVVSPASAEELFKGGLTATIISAVHQAGFAKSLGLGLYAQSWFPTPTASDQYLRAASPTAAYNRGAGTIYFPGPGGALVPAGPAAAAGMGFHRFRSRYAGNY